MDVGFKPNHLIPWFSCVPSIVFFSVVSIEIAHCLNIVKISENSVRSLQFHMLRMVYVVYVFLLICCQCSAVLDRSLGRHSLLLLKE